MKNVVMIQGRMLQEALSHKDRACRENNGRTIKLACQYVLGARLMLCSSILLLPGGKRIDIEPRILIHLKFVACGDDTGRLPPLSMDNEYCLFDFLVCL